MPKQIDLCIDARMAAHSGIGTCIRELIPFFSSDSFRLVLLVKEEQKWATRYEQILFTSPIYSIEEQILFPIKIPTCDVFWSPHYNIPLLPIQAKKRVSTIHDACHLAMDHLFSLPERIYAKFMMNRAIRQSDCVSTDSFFSKNELIRYLKKRKKDLHVIYYGVNRNRFRPILDNRRRKEVREKYQLPDKFLLFVGNLKPHKNIAGLIAAFQSVKIADLSLVLVGKFKDLRHSVETLAQDRVLVVGEILDEELPVFYSMAELFIFPSYYEGFGLPPLEAMSCGCPVAVSNAASLPEICQDAVLYFDPHRSEEICGAIHRILSDRSIRHRLIENGFDRSNKFSWENAAKSYMVLFKD